MVCEYAISSGVLLCNPLGNVQLLLSALPFTILATSLLLLGVGHLRTTLPHGARCTGDSWLQRALALGPDNLSGTGRINREDTRWSMNAVFGGELVLAGLARVGPPHVLPERFPHNVVPVQAERVPTQMRSGPVPSTRVLVVLQQHQHVRHYGRSSLHTELRGHFLILPSPLVEVHDTLLPIGIIRICRYLHKLVRCELHAIQLVGVLSRHALPGCGIRRSNGTGRARAEELAGLSKLAHVCFVLGSNV